MKFCTRVRLTVLVSACVLALVAATAWSQRLTWLGTLGGGWSEATAVSANGRVVVGWSKNVRMQTRAFRWENGKMQDLGVLPGGNWSVATAVSADGRVVVGNATNAKGQLRAFRWENGKMQDLGVLPGGDMSGATAVSADGRVIIGYATDAKGHTRAVRWEAGAIFDLGTPIGSHSKALAVSADGSAVVGYFTTAGGKRRAFRWTQAGGIQELGTLRSDEESMATAVSADGRVVVGWARRSVKPRFPLTLRVIQQTRAFRWENGKMQDLGVLPGGDMSEATAVSADGRVVVGNATNAKGQLRAFRWENGKMHHLSVPLGGDRSESTAVSADGHVVVGRALKNGDSLVLRWTALGNMEDLNAAYASLLKKGAKLWLVTAVTPDGRCFVGAGDSSGAVMRKEAFLLDTRAAPRAPAQKQLQQRRPSPRRVR